MCTELFWLSSNICNLNNRAVIEVPGLNLGHVIHKS
jgi:hypothetical protein